MLSLYYIIIFLFVITCFLLCMVILSQESKSTGLGASFGGDNSESLFGTSTADILKKITRYLAIIFMVTCLILSFWTGVLGKKQQPINVHELTVPPGA